MAIIRVIGFIPYSGDGKSASASNLAIGLANAGRKVRLIDAELRKPSLHKVFGLITASPEPDNPAELLASSRFAAVLDEIRTMYDTIISR